MMSLYNDDRSLDKEKSASKLKSFFKSCYENGSVEIKNLQNKINDWTQLAAYEHHRLFDQGAIIASVNELCQRFIKYLDSTEKKFVASFAGSYRASVFELVMANFISKKFDLIERIKRDGLPDLEFVFNGKSYFLECTTRNSSLMDKFAEHLPDFDCYHEIANIFDAKCKELKEVRSLWKHNQWVPMIEQLWWELSAEQKDIISSKLACLHGEIKNHSQILDKIKTWMIYNLDAYYNFKEILPNELSEKLGVIVPLIRTPDIPVYMSFLVRSIAQQIIDKLKNLYAGEGVPLVISISLATLPDYMLTPLVLEEFFSKNMQIQLQEKLNEVAKSKEEMKKILENIKNLYAVIIDVTWYNWFPEIAAEYGARFNGDKKNCYLVIYNTSISKNLCHDEHIFDSLISKRIDLSLSVESDFVVEAVVA